MEPFNELRKNEVQKRRENIENSVTFQLIATKLSFMEWGSIEDSENSYLTFCTFVLCTFHHFCWSILTRVFSELVSAEQFLPIGSLIGFKMLRLPISGVKPINEEGEYKIVNGPVCFQH